MDITNGSIQRQTVKCADAHTGNFVVNTYNAMMPIDLQILHPGEDALNRD
jgi:hypothetical protein